ncbi:hypothetical protein LRS10_18420 [Phenylobacterium sp. J426]|uniref:hypothetical protein n=1 Tax=Phenylobacterium sp. J426 TaxID=2898439 RepID=UPI00215104D9|nr:hypothetical protein [Phenylobacterium sp. J426]MCR5875951.1 hypothetical protein [Phenylobacterium sp. J426]
MAGQSFEPDFDDQDQSEIFDETNAGEGGDAGEVRSYADASERRTFEELPDVPDLTQLIGDRDDDEAVALDADEFDPDAVDDGDFEEDNELDYRAATEEREDDIDGLGPEDSFNEDRILRTEIEGLHEVRDADEAEGGEDDFTDFQARNVSDEDLKELGYSEDRGGETRAKPDE